MMFVVCFCMPVWLFCIHVMICRNVLMVAGNLFMMAFVVHVITSGMIMKDFMLVMLSMSVSMWYCMVMAEMAAGKCCDEYCEAKNHKDAFPSEMSYRFPLAAFVMT